MYDLLRDINTKPQVFGEYTTEALWADEYRAKQMLAYHLNREVDLSSRNHAFIDRSAAWIVDKFKLSSGNRVCDFGCGPGLYTSRFAEAGAEVTGLDFSKNSIQYAREQAAHAEHRINYIHTNYLEFDPKQRFDLITMIMCDFCVLSPAQRKQLLAIFRECLEDDGAILLDVYSMTAYAQREEACFYEKNQLNQFWCEEDYYCFVNTFKYDAHAVVLDKYSVFPKSSAAETVYNWLQYFSPESLEKEFSDTGFSIEHVYRDVSGQPFAKDHPEFAVVARKRTR